MPARRRRLLIKKTRKKSKIRAIWVVFFLSFFVFLLSYFFLNKDLWNNKSKLSLAIREKNEDVVVVIFDPLANEITTLLLPGNTEVSVARNLGIWKLRSVWKLGENENYDGRLLSETITRHFRFPIDAWADSPALGFTNTSPGALVRAAFLPYKTSLKSGDKIRLALFSLQIRNIKREEINFAETYYLKKTKFIDGEEGYVVSGEPSPKVSALFADPKIVNKGVIVVIKDASSGGLIAQEVGKLVEVLGAKVASIVKEEPEEIDCCVSGKDKEIVSKVARLLSCSQSKTKIEGSFDLEIKLGNAFAGRF